MQMQTATRHQPQLSVGISKMGDILPNGTIKESKRTSSKIVCFSPALNSDLQLTFRSGSSNNSTSDHDSAPGVSASVIAGGVVGGVVGVVFLGGALWVFLRSRRHQKSRPISGEKDWYGTIPNLKPELAADGLSLTSYSTPRQPVHGIDVSSAVEAGGAARYEMQG